MCHRDDSPRISGNSMTTGERHEVMDPLKILGGSKADGSLSVCIQTVAWGVLLVDLAVGTKRNAEVFLMLRVSPVSRVMGQMVEEMLLAVGK